MKIFNAAQLFQWDQYTIQHEPIASIDLMERAARKCVEWLTEKFPSTSVFRIICGKGNNGGDGLAITRLLIEKGYQAETYILEFGNAGTSDFQINLQRLHDIPASIHYLQEGASFPVFANSDIIIDALFGTGINKPITGFTADLVHQINKSKARIISIDIPSGLYLDHSSGDNTVITAMHTLTFQVYKLALLLAENAIYFGHVHLLDIGLHQAFEKQETSIYHFTEKTTIQNIFKPRKTFTHKGNYGHALVVAGSEGKYGAALLATKACLHTGAGLTTAYIPVETQSALLANTPEAMFLAHSDFIQELKTGTLDKFNAIAIGPGLGTDEYARELVYTLLKYPVAPFVLDADALNCLAKDKEKTANLPPNAILTPHPKEFDRLFGEQPNDFERLEKARLAAMEHHIIIVLKGHRTAVCLPDGTVHFNSTGNAGLAKGGSGDVLTGMVAALLAQKYSPADAAILGVYLHGLTAELASRHLALESMTATNIIHQISEAFLTLYPKDLLPSQP